VAIIEGRLVEDHLPSALHPCNDRQLPNNAWPQRRGWDGASQSTAVFGGPEGGRQRCVAEVRADQSTASLLILCCTDTQAVPATSPSDPRGLRALAIGAALLVTSCTTFDGEIMVTRSAKLRWRIETTDRRTGVACTATALLFGEKDTAVSTTSGEVGQLTVAMLTPLKLPQPLSARVAIEAACDGYAPLRTAEREVEPAWLRAPSMDVGTLTVQPASTK